MAGTKLGGARAAKANKRKYGKDYYQRIGRLGGKDSNKGGFYHMMVNNPEKHKQVSRLGGEISRRGAERSPA